LGGGQPQFGGYWVELWLDLFGVFPPPPNFTFRQPTQGEKFFFWAVAGVKGGRAGPFPSIPQQRAPPNLFSPDFFHSARQKNIRSIFRAWLSRLAEDPDVLSYRKVFFLCFLKVAGLD